MRLWLIGRAAAVLALLVLAMPAAADDLADFNAAVEQAASHNRVALGYLRTGNLDLASVELGRLRDSWTDLTQRFSQTPPPQLQSNPLFAQTLADVPARASSAETFLNAGSIDEARHALQAIREELSAMRKRSGIVVLADCVLDANAAMADFFVYDETPPDWAIPSSVADFSGHADAIASVMRRCDSIASPDVRESPEFRRLIDGTMASLAFVPKAVETRDNDLIHRLIDELRAFDNLLTFRYG